MTPRRPARKPSGLTAAAVLVAGVAVLYFAQDVLQPVVLSVLLAFLLARPVSWLERRRAGRLVSVVTVVGVACLLIAGLGFVVGRQVYSLAEDLPKYTDNINTKVDRVFAYTNGGSSSGVGEFLTKLSASIRRASQTPATQASASQPADDATPGDGVFKGAAKEFQNPKRALAREATGGPPATAPGPAGSTPDNPIYTVSQGSAATPWQQVQTYLAAVGGPLGTAGLIFVFAIFILLEREALRDRFIAVISRGNYTVTTRAINDAADRISRYLVAQVIVNGSTGFLLGSGLFVIGLAFGHGSWFPSFVLWGLLAAVLRFVPYVGPALASLFPIALALAVYPGFSVAVAVVAWCLTVELFSNNVLETWLYGQSTGLGTVAILVSAIFWTWIWGTVGLLVATPLTVILAVAGKYVGPLNFMHVLLSDEDALPPAVQYYQRLLAGDRPEAERVVAKVAGAVKTTGTATGLAADVVYLPALRLARRDRADDELTPEAEKRIYDDTLSIVRPAGAVAAPAAPATVPEDGSPLVLCYPSHHRADEVTLHVLAEALSPLGVKTAVMTTRQLPADVEAAVARDKPAFLVIAVMPPGGLPQTRYLCQRLRKKFPDLHILVGFWGRARNFDRLLVRLRKAGASYVLTNIEQTRGQIGAMLPKPPVTEPPADPVVSPS